jgi:hypothetical protein
MRVLFSILAPSVGAGFNCLTENTALEEAKVICLPKDVSKMWTKLAQAGNLNVDEDLFQKYREGVAEASKETFKCQANKETDYHEDQIGTPEFELLYEGKRAEALGDFKHWQDHPMVIKDGKCLTFCDENYDVIRVTETDVTFYNVEEGSLLTETSELPCDTMMAGFLNYYALMPTCMLDGKPEWKAGRKEQPGKCIEAGSRNAKDGVEVLREGKWKDVEGPCVSLRLVENGELRIAPGSCECPAGFEYEPQTSGVQIYARDSTTTPTP